MSVTCGSVLTIGWLFIADQFDGSYEEAYRRSLERPEEFWGELGHQLIHWDKPFEKVLDNQNAPFTKW